jgi:hypothetical protein
MFILLATKKTAVLPILAEDSTALTWRRTGEVALRTAVNGRHRFIGRPNNYGKDF